MLRPSATPAGGRAVRRLGVGVLHHRGWPHRGLGQQGHLQRPQRRLSPMPGGILSPSAVCGRLGLMRRLCDAAAPGGVLGHLGGCRLPSSPQRWCCSTPLKVHRTEPGPPATDGGGMGPAPFPATPGRRARSRARAASFLGLRPAGQSARERTEPSFGLLLAGKNDFFVWCFSCFVWFESGGPGPRELLFSLMCYSEAGVNF